MMRSSGGGFVVNVSIDPDDDGFIGRECPITQCEGYFKITPGTGLSGSPTCYCPYCGHSADHDEFSTKEQVEYAQSVAFNRYTDELLKGLRRHEFRSKPQGGLINFSMKVTGSPHPIAYYREKLLETEVTCASCTLRYAVYGVFAVCPDCGAHNSVQMLEKNLELATKQIALAASVDAELAEYLINDALENEVAAFDGFGREICLVNATKSSAPPKAEKLSFQNLPRAQEQVRKLFGFDLTSAVKPDEWATASRCFQKRHLLAHKMGVVDHSYVNETGDTQAVVGRKIRITGSEVEELAEILRRIGNHLATHLNRLP